MNFNKLNKSIIIENIIALLYIKNTIILKNRKQKIYTEKRVSNYTTMSWRYEIITI